MRARVASPRLAFAERLTWGLAFAFGLASGCGALNRAPPEPPPQAIVDDTGACAVSGLCAPGYAWSMDACGCVPGSACGQSLCAPGLVCCNQSCGICAPPEAPCAQEVCAAPSGPRRARRR